MNHWRFFFVQFSSTLCNGEGIAFFVLPHPMYLKRLELSGFKSFAHKTVLEFNRQLTAIVGPNGSGKSNVTDAVRWVLGEQSVKLLRGKRAEDVIFAGSDIRSRLGMAEVSLHLDNNDQSAPIEFSDVVITRRVFRDGQSEYLLNGSSVRLHDIQILLAKASFGQKTYSVIGQGMIDSVLLSSPAERKEFFEEATGVKQYQLKREQAIQKLTGTYENLEQANVLLAEIEPRLRSLTRQVKRLERREELERELRELQKGYYRYRYQELDRKRSEAVKRSGEQEHALAERQEASKRLDIRLKELEKASQAAARSRELADRLSELRGRRERLIREQALEHARRQVKHLERGQGELVWLTSRRDDLATEVQALEKKSAGLRQEHAAAKQQLEAKVAEQASVLETFAKVQSSGAVGWLKQELSLLVDSHADIRGKLLSADSLARVRELAGEFKQLEERLSVLMRRVGEGQGATPDLAKLLLERDAAVQQVAQLTAAVEHLAREERATEEKLAATGKELDKVGRTLASGSAETGGTDAEAELTEVDKELKRTEEELAGFERTRERTSSEAFSLQRQLQGVREEERAAEQGLHEVSLERARLETRLEDLERELAQEVTPELVHSIKEPGSAQPVDEGSVALEIQKLKHQLELTGGIEPEVVNEYQQTKTRFDFLTAQVADLTQAAASLETIINDLDETIEERFVKSFKQINEKFVQYFKVLFDGGKAELVLQREEAITEKAEEGGPQDEEDSEEDEDEAKPEVAREQTARERFLKAEKVRAQLFSGVEIRATPAGKKLSSITALSGGEKALTSIALISAIISCNPSPFVFLDEVDAALDESNSERFAAILDSLMDRTQFICVTHNRATMRRAAILYGITMGEDGVSKLLSVKFDQADELAAKPKAKKN